MKEFLNITLEKEVNELLPLRDDLIQTISTVYEILPTFEYPKPVTDFKIGDVVYSNHYFTAKKHTVVNIVDNVVELAVDFDGEEHPQYFMKTDIDGLWQECRKSAFNEVFQTGEYRETAFKTTFYSKEDWDKLKEVENYSVHLDTVRYHLNELKELINSKNK